MVDNTPLDPLQGATQWLRAAMLDRYARRLGLEPDVYYEGHFTNHWVWVEDKDHRALDLVHELARKGCVDVHVFTTDGVLADMIEFSHHGLFRVCSGESPFGFPEKENDPADGAAGGESVCRADKS